MKSLHGHPRGRRTIWAGGVTLMLALGATAAETPQPTTRSPGLMTFPNVKVVDAPAVAPTSQTSAGANSGMRASVNEQTRRLRELTADEAQTLSRDARARPTKQLAQARRNAAASSATDVDSDTTETLIGPDGSTGVLLDEESAVFQLAHKNAHGAVDEECVTGEHVAAANVKGGKHSSSKHSEEVRHDR